MRASRFHLQRLQLLVYFGQLVSRNIAHIAGILGHNLLSCIALASAGCYQLLHKGANIGRAYGRCRCLFRLCFFSFCGLFNLSLLFLWLFNRLGLSD